MESRPPRDSVRTPLRQHVEALGDDMAHTPRSARILAASLALLVPCTGCRHRTASARRPDSATLARIDTLAATWMGRRSVPGLSIAIASHGQILFARGYGVAALRGDRAGPVTPETVFELGSIKKPVTAAIVMQLAERRLVDVDSPASRWIEQINTMRTRPRARHAQPGLRPPRGGRHHHGARRWTSSRAPDGPTGMRTSTSWTCWSRRPPDRPSMTTWPTR